LSKCPFKNMKMSKIRSHIGLAVLAFSLGLLTTSCNSKAEHRPSPPASDSVQVNGVSINVEYSSPGVKKRKIWGELVPYNEIWRTGANKATFLNTSGDIRINGETLPKGTYAIFTIPTDSTWTIIFNEEWDQWGSYNYNQNKDIFRLIVTPSKSDFDERMKFTLTKNALTFDWEELSYKLTIDTQ